MSSCGAEDRFDAWNPGIVSDLPREYLPLATVYAEENVATPLAEALELSDFCGIAPHQLVAFRAERLVIHEILIRISADLTVPDGFAEADLGINFRRMASAIHDGHVRPHQAELEAVLKVLGETAAALISGELDRRIFSPPRPTKPERKSFWPFSRSRKAPAKGQQAAEPAAERHTRAIAEWRRLARDAESPHDRACFDALATVAAAICSRRGSLVGDADIITRLAVTLVCNAHGSERIGEALEPHFDNAVEAEGFRRLPVQESPVVVNVKGASASGKSTLRPYQRALVEQLDLSWQDFALISPDIWRKYLLDYDTLGPAYKYAGTLSGLELEIVDRKLDGYMARKAAAGNMTHLLIDRFRFDSFTAESEGDDASRLLTRFGELIYIYFMITPPHMTVERAWHRGLKFGRFKAVDDLLHHNIEAFTGMPDVFFTWASRTRKRVHFEFLDNSVAKGERPRTVAFGWNGEMNVLDVKALLDVDRYKKIEIDARRPEDVYDPQRMAPEANTEFLKRCARLLTCVNFADQETGAVYASLEHGHWTIRDRKRFEAALADPDTRAGLAAIGAGGTPPAGSHAAEALTLDTEAAHTLGAWGEGV